MAANGRFPGPYTDTVPQNVDEPGPFIHRVKFSFAEIGSRRSVLNGIAAKNDMSISHTPNQNAGSGGGERRSGKL